MKDKGKSGLRRAAVIAVAAAMTMSAAAEEAKWTRALDGVAGNFWDAHFDRRAVPGGHNPR